MTRITQILFFAIALSSILVACQTSKQTENITFPKLERPTQVYLESWDIGDYPMYLKAPEKEGGSKVIRIVATDGSVGYVPLWVSRGGISGEDNQWEWEGGLTDQVVEIMKTTDLLDHELLYDRMLEAGIPSYIIAAADVAAWDLHARMLNKPLHALLGTQRTKAIRYGDVRGVQPDFSPEQYAQKVADYLKRENLIAVKLHFPGAMRTHESISFEEVILTLRLVREAVGPDAVLAYDPYPYSAESATTSMEEAKELLNVLDELNYTWIEGPLDPMPEETQIKKYAELMQTGAKVKIQPEGHGPIGDITPFETLRGWGDEGAANQFSTDVYFTDGLTPIVRMIQWAKNRPQQDFVLNLHWSWLPHLHLAMTCSDDIYPYVELPMSHEIPASYFQHTNYALAPDWPGIYLMQEPMENEWEDIGATIFESIPDYEEYNDRLYTGAGNLVVIPSSGELFLTLNRTYGMFKSSDTGETWEKVENTHPVGRSYGGFSTDLDQQTGRFALFMILSTVHPYSVMTLDQGKTWSAITRPKHIVHDGWTWGSVDWTSDEPKVMIGKQHHNMTGMWLSTDAGQSWEKLPFESRNPGVINENILIATKGEHGEGIFRSTDQGKTWNQVSDFRVNGKIPVRWENRYYWTAFEGVIVSEDQGASWNLLGSPLPGALWGPYFGKDDNALIVVNEVGIYKSTNAGETWNKIANHPETISYDIMHPNVSFGWDYNRNILYCSPVGGTVYRLKL